MGWEIGEDRTRNRFIGYGVPAYCDHPRCDKKIDRGLSYVCGNEEPYGGEYGCGLYFCEDHLGYYTENRHSVCKRCGTYKDPYKPKPEHPEWIHHLLTDESWAEWRAENPREVERLVAHQPRSDQSDGAA